VSPVLGTEMICTNLRLDERKAKSHAVKPAALFLSVEASDAMVVSVASDALLLGIWGFVRLASRPMTLGEISDVTKVDPAMLQRKLDLLVSYGIAEALASTARRRATAYRARYAGMQVRVQRTGQHEVLRGVAASMSEHVRSLVSRSFVSPGPNESRGWHADFTGLLNLKPDEVDELRRRLNRVVEYTSMLGEKYAARGEPPELCNYVLNFRVEPLESPALPLAPIRFVLADADDPVREVSTNARRKARLSPREREVGIALARGLTAEETASKLGIKRSTVATMTKRIYKKLGVHRRAELVSKLEDAIGGSLGSSTD
jgi:DNA-binding CsgD family transcriptional regulator